MTFKIMCIGDSITEFVKDAEHCPQGYRYELWKLLVDLGRPFEMLGEHSYTKEYGTQYPKYKGETFQDACNAWGGWKTYDLLVGKHDGWGANRGNVRTWLDGESPDVVLLMAGTNDAWALQTPDNVEAYMRSIVNIIQQKANCAIVLGKLIPMGAKLGPDICHLVQFYNERFDRIADDMSTDKHRVVTCDNFTGYDAEVDNACDTEYNVHPGISGAKKIAANFVKAMTE